MCIIHLRPAYVIPRLEHHPTSRMTIFIFGHATCPSNLQAASGRRIPFSPSLNQLLAVELRQSCHHMPTVRFGRISDDRLPRPRYLALLLTLTVQPHLEAWKIKFTSRTEVTRDEIPGITKVGAYVFTILLSPLHSNALFLLYLGNVVCQQPKNGLRLECDPRLISLLLLSSAARQRIRSKGMVLSNTNVNRGIGSVAAQRKQKNWVRQSMLYLPAFRTGVDEENRCMFPERGKVCASYRPRLTRRSKRFNPDTCQCMSPRVDIDSSLDNPTKTRP